VSEVESAYSYASDAYWKAGASPKLKIRRRRASDTISEVYPELP
jgi:hypothetical protein